MANHPSSESNHPIDVVIAWVDGNDPKLTEKRNRYLNKTTNVTISSGAHATRFASVNEIKYCVLSILKFAPFVRNIFIVTDGQDPDISEEIKIHFPERLSSIKIVDHTEIFEGFENCLPTFNSISIGHMIWRIKGLSDNFVYFNDDTFLIREMKPDEWFINNRPVLRGKWLPAPRLRILRDTIMKIINNKVRGDSSFQPRASFHIGQWNSASVLGLKWRYFSNSHTPHTVARQTVENFFNGNRSLLEKNISYRFREYSQFTFISLANHLELINGNKNIAGPGLAYLQPYNRSKDYIDKKISICRGNPSIKYLCVQSLEMCPKEDQEKILNWMESLLKIS